MIAIGVIGYEVVSIVSDLSCTSAFLKAYKHLDKMKYIKNKIAGN